ncbi:MAG: carbohydrate ABC transporter permease [Candidatus Ornithospirochaeta sp.]|nr:carbohydrate ABC transporter permease [Sphaerochaetaceae bacterium]MDY5524240.1 carbohydrate ABC transporter permease [Candidatus Ornithospirochaeta sp.]
MTHRRKELIEEIVVSLVAIALGLVIIFPLIYCFLSSFKTPSEFLDPKLLPSSFLNLDNYKAALERGNLLRYILNSFVIAFLGSAIRLIFSILAAYVFAFYDFKGKNVVFFMILGTMMIPSDVLLATNYLTVSRLHLLNTYMGVMVVSFVSASATFMLRQRFKTIPRDMREAASMDGYGDIWFILRVLLPITRPVVTTLFVQSFISLWNSYLWPLIATASSPEMRTVMVGITRLNSWEDENYQLVMAGVVISLIPSIILFLIMRRSLRKGGLEGSLVG